MPRLDFMIRYYWTFIIAGLALVFIGLPAILTGHVLRKVFGIEDFIFPFAKLGCRIYLRSAGARVHVRGREHLDPNQAYVFAANHQSNLDPPLVFAYVGHNVGALAKKELTRIPIMKQGFPLAHVVPIDRRNREAALESTRRGAEELCSGHSLMAFPEGTRTVDGRVREFKRGVFFMALEAGVPIVPTVINDTRLVMRKGEKRVVPGDVFIELLPPIDVAGYSAAEIDPLIEKVRDQIAPRVRAD
ncbi:MAG: lysophospholipid acyltransferase family protein [Blastocatellia bacterium]